MSDFDANACIRMLRDKSLEEGHREAAADSLMSHASPEAASAILGVILDSSECSEFRTEVAGALANVWVETGYNVSDLACVPEPFSAVIKRELDLIAQMKNRGPTLPNQP